MTRRAAFMLGAAGGLLALAAAAVVVTIAVLARDIEEAFRG